MKRFVMRLALDISIFDPICKDGRGWTTEFGSPFFIYMALVVTGRSLAPRPPSFLGSTIFDRGIPFLPSQKN